MTEKAKLLIQIAELSLNMASARATARDVKTFVNRYCKYHQSILTIEQFTHFGKTFNILIHSKVTQKYDKQDFCGMLMIC